MEISDKPTDFKVPVTIQEQVESTDPIKKNAADKAITAIDIINTELSKVRTRQDELDEEKDLASLDAFGTEYAPKLTPTWILAIQWVFHVAILLIMLKGEVPYNEGALEVFHRPKSDTKWMAYTFGLVYIAIGFFGGYFAKRFWVTKEWGNFWISLITTLTGIAVVVSLTLLRMSYLAANEESVDFNVVTGTLPGIGLILVTELTFFFTTSSAKDLRAEKKLREILGELDELEKKSEKLTKRYETAIATYQTTIEKADQRATVLNKKQS